MMKLHQVDISGFKTFVDPVRVTFAGGITGLVGPNGCGKSNLVDAIVWVLGEQSAKSLRSSTMEDVIFNGSEGRKPIGMAEVNLTLITDPSFEHAIDGKVEIGRRVFRSGESQYRLNGKLKRLKEIKDLLMDTGLGFRAYSVIEQGKIGMILSGKPQERRRLLEEAAGITKYKQRKHVAEVKLEEALANLLRLDDIISEVERSLRSLKRQASAARRYQEKEAEYRGLLRQVLLGRWSRLRDHLGDVDGRLDGLVDEDASTTADLHRAEAAVAEAREELDRLSRELAERHQQHADLAATIEGRQEFIKGTRHRLAEVHERVTRGQAQAEERLRQADDLRGSLGSLDQRSLALIEEREQAARLVEEDETRIAAAQKAVEEAEARLEATRRGLLASLARVNQLRSEVQHEQVEIEKRAYRQRFLGDEHTRLGNQLADAEAALAAVVESIAAHERRLEELVGRRATLAAELELLLRRESEGSDEARRLEGTLDRLRQRRDILVELSEEHADRRRLLVEKLRAIGLAEPRFLADAARPVEGWEDGIDQFLGEVADAVLVDPAQPGLELARALAGLDASGIFLVPLADTGAEPDVDDPAVHFSLAEALGLPAELGRALPPAYLVEQAADAARLAARHPGVAFLSRERVWALSGTLRVQSAAAAPGVLARESELDALGTEIPATEASLERARETLATVAAERTARAQSLNRLDEELAVQRRELAVAQARRQDATSRRDRVRGELDTVSEEQREIEAELAVKTARRAEIAEGLAAADAEHQRLTEGHDAAQGQVEAAKEKRETLREAGAGRRGRLELLEERMDSQSQEVARVKRQIEETRRQVEAWNEEREQLERRHRELEIEIDKAEDELQAALERRGEAQDDVLAQQEVLDQKREDIRTLEDELQTLRASREDLRTRIESLRVERAGLRQDAEHLGATYRDGFRRNLPGFGQLHVAPPAVAGEDEVEDDDGAVVTVDERPPEEPAAAKPAPGDDDEDGELDDVELSEEDLVVPVDVPEDEVDVPAIDRARLAELEGHLSRCKAILERLGPVNVLAAREYEEQHEREGFLKTQRKDIVESVESLKKTIREINETSSERFKETFAMVNKTFGETFSNLFRGGEAEMRLLDEEDLLESGIEIVARPPGKRPQNIMLLSGGEKALTAVALLFALFQAKPSPFCILDEVDAPLDDSNVLRFVETLRLMSRETQFLVVTHNKLTMEVASTLYGVTMEERGVSKLVSVELDDVHVEPSRLAATA